LGACQTPTCDLTEPEPRRDFDFDQSAGTRRTVF
jgi:hypothetical protein